MRLVALAVAVSMVFIVGCGKKKRAAENEGQEAKADSKKSASAASTVPGVTEDEIVLGQSSVFLGPNAGYGTEYYRGAMAYFMETNANGGVHGRKIRIKPVDDAYDPVKAADNARAFVAANDTFSLFGTISTKQIADIGAVLLEKKDQHWFLFGNHSGSQPHREMPLRQVVFNVRTSYRREGEALVDALVASGKKKIAIFQEDGPYGAAVTDAYTRALAKHDLKPVAVAKYKVGMKFDESAAEQVKTVRGAGADAVLAAAVYQSAAAFVRDAREGGWDAPMGFNSPVSDTFLRTLNAYEQKNQKKIATRLLHAQVTPALDSPLPGMVEYRELMDKRNPMPPQELVDPNYRTNRYGFTSAEAFFAAKTMVEIFKRTGPNLTRERFKQTAEQLSNYDPGLGGATLTITPDNHEGISKAWLLGVKNGAFVDVSEPKEYLNDKAAPAPAQAKK